MCGGDPSHFLYILQLKNFSPHVRGWSSQKRSISVNQRLFPACAGVILPIVCRYCAVIYFSPHVRGWSLKRFNQAIKAQLFPACAGVIPLQCQQLKRYWHLPCIKNQIEYLGQNTLRWWENSGRGADLPLIIGTGCFRHSNISCRQISRAFPANSSIADSRYLK